MYFAGSRVLRSAFGGVRVCGFHPSDVCPLSAFRSSSRIEGLVRCNKFGRYLTISSPPHLRALSATRTMMSALRGWSGPTSLRQASTSTTMALAALTFGDLALASVIGFRRRKPRHATLPGGPIVSKRSQTIRIPSGRIVFRVYVGNTLTAGPYTKIALWPSESPEACRDLNDLLREQARQASPSHRSNGVRRGSRHHASR